MKRILVIIGLIVLLTLPLVSLSCAGGASRINAVLGQEFILPVGQTANIESEGLTIQFVGVDADSRCPNFAKCVSAGEVRCNMRFTIAGSAADVILTQIGGTASSGTDYFINYSIAFKVEPYPEIGKTIAPADYKITMTVTKP